KYLLPIGFSLYAGVVIVLRSILHYRRTGASPIVVPRDDSVHGFVGRLIVWMFAGMIADIALFVASDNLYGYLVPIPWLQVHALQIMAIFVLAISLIWIATAQTQMGPSFRIGIDEQHETALVERGLYRISRNPIYVGMMAALTAFLLLLPNALTLLIWGL